MVIQAGAMAKGGRSSSWTWGTGKDHGSSQEPDPAFRFYLEDIKIQDRSRPGEAYEELLMDEEGLTARSMTRSLLDNPPYGYQVLKLQMETFNKILYHSDDEIRDYMRTIVPTYRNIV